MVSKWKSLARNDWKFESFSDNSMFLPLLNEQSEINPKFPYVMNFTLVKKNLLKPSNMEVIFFLKNQVRNE